VNTILRSTFLVHLLCAAPFACGQATGPAALQSPAVSETAQERATAAPFRFSQLQGPVEERVEQLLAEMTIDEKIGQLIQVYPADEQHLDHELATKIERGEVGSVFFPGSHTVPCEAQYVARELSRLGIPLLIARDVVHGFRTVQPIPLAQAATWNPSLVRRAAHSAAIESMTEGVDWTFAPMIDVCRDARWGRIAETLGEDPLLAGRLGGAMVAGFQNEDQQGNVRGVLACAKHYVGYGLSEGGRDYNRVSVSNADLHNVFLPPFRAAQRAGCRSIMTTFSEINGVPGTAHRELLHDILKGKWKYDGVVVSDWGSIPEMVTHGFASDNSVAAEMAINAGVDVDMCSPAFATHLRDLIADNQVSAERLDDAVRRVLTIKFQIFEGRKQVVDKATAINPRLVARQLVRESVVLLDNKQNQLPLNVDELKHVAVIGPLADAPAEQLGCWALDGDVSRSVTPLHDLQRRLGSKVELTYAPGVAYSFDPSESQIERAVEAARKADIALVYLGEDAVLSGEARSRSSLDLPGRQGELLRRVAATDTPVVLIVLAGRPLAIGNAIEQCQATLFAWHPGSMGGPGIHDVLFGVVAPSGKLPVTFPRSAGQVPIYYNHSNTGRPGPVDYRPLLGTDLRDLPKEFQYRSHYLDLPITPLFPFGFGLSYTQFAYSELSLDRSTITPGSVAKVRCKLTNTGSMAATETSQLYVRVKQDGVVRPVRELKGFCRSPLSPGESTMLEFAVPYSSLLYADNEGKHKVGSADVEVFVGTDSTTNLSQSLRLVDHASSAVPSVATSEAEQPEID
jgi:beta-glucosidase